MHGFLSLSAMDGAPLAQGYLVQLSANDRLTNHLVFPFKDGSLHDETAVYSQRGNFRLFTYHLIQKGPTFGHHTDISFDTTSNNVTVHYSERDGKEKATTVHMELPPDIANGLILTLLKNLRPDGPPTTVSMVATTPDIHVWVLGGEAPAFVKMEGPLFCGGPIWRIELASPVWPKRIKRSGRLSP